MIVELCVLVGSEVYDIRLNAVWALMVSGYLKYIPIYVPICI